MTELTNNLTMVSMFLHAAHEHIHMAKKKLNDEIRKEAPNSCQALLEADQKIELAMGEISMFLEEIQSGKYPG